MQKKSEINFGNTSFHQIDTKHYFLIDFLDSLCFLSLQRIFKSKYTSHDNRCS